MQAYKGSRKTIKVYLLVCVCLDYGGVFIGLMEGLGTEDILSQLTILVVSKTFLTNGYVTLSRSKGDNKMALN